MKKSLLLILIAAFALTACGGSGGGGTAADGTPLNPITPVTPSDPGVPALPPANPATGYDPAAPALKTTTTSLLTWSINRQEGGGETIISPVPAGIPDGSTVEFSVNLPTGAVSPVVATVVNGTVTTTLTGPDTVTVTATLKTIAAIAAKSTAKTVADIPAAGAVLGSVVVSGDGGTWGVDGGPYDNGGSTAKILENEIASVGPDGFTIAEHTYSTTTNVISYSSLLIYDLKGVQTQKITLNNPATWIATDGVNYFNADASIKKYSPSGSVLWSVPGFSLHLTYDKVSNTLAYVDYTNKLIKVLFADTGLVKQSIPISFSGFNVVQLIINGDDLYVSVQENDVDKTSHITISHININTGLTTWSNKLSNVITNPDYLFKGLRNIVWETGFNDLP